MPASDDQQLAVALGANLPSVAGAPRDTLLSVQPLLERAISTWSGQQLGFYWSPLIETEPVGGPADQPSYVNAVVLVKGLAATPTAAAALALLDGLHALERRYGRNREIEQRWGPRTLDLDLLFWGEWRLEHPRLVLPHPRMHLRTFVLQPLLAAMQASVPSAQR